MLLALFLLLAGKTSAQDALVPPQLKGRWFIYWGYNRAQFTTSNIHFTGPGYDFILHDVTAVDKPEPFSFGNYFNLKNIWIPQYNYRVGRFFGEHWAFSIGLDHMKYVVQREQEVELTGTISTERSAAYAGTEAHRVRLTPDLLQYEHTDGLNLLSIDADRYGRLWHSHDAKQALYLTAGLFVGPVIPRTDVRLFSEGLNNKFHLAGYGAGAQVGATFMGFGRVFARAQVRAGYIELPSVLTTGTSEDRARQRFWFTQENLVFGVFIGK